MPGARKWKWTDVVLAALGIGFLVVVLVTALPMIGIGGNRVEHGWVTFDVHPKGTGIVFSSASGDLFTFDFATQSVKRLTSTMQIEMDPKYSPDGKSIAFSRSDGTSASAIYEIPAIGGSEKKIVGLSEQSDSMGCFSADGKRIVFVRAATNRPYSFGGMVWDDYDLHIYDMQTGTSRRITREGFYGCGSPTILEDSGEVAFSAMGRGKDLDSRMFRVPIAGDSRPTPFLPPPPGIKGAGAWASDVVFSKDGKKLAFISDRANDFQYDLYIADASGENMTAMELTKVSRYNQSPAFMPDGKSLLVLAGTEWNSGSRPIFSLYRVNLDGKAEKVADSGLFTDPLAWKPKS